MGRRAVALLRERIQGRTQALHPVFDVRMQVRGSTLGVDPARL